MKNRVKRLMKEAIVLDNKLAKTEEHTYVVRKNKKNKKIVKAKKKTH